MRKISVASPVFDGNEKKYVLDCLETGWISSIGKYIHTFEEQFAAFCGVRHALACSNGTVAIHLALLAYDIKPGDEVLVPTLTYIASANAVTYCGAKPVFVDSEPETWNLDPSKIEEKITPRTRGIIVVPLYGHPADMDPIMALAKKHNLFVVEDAAEAHGALYHGKKAGSQAHVSTFSFFGNKVITTGEGGMVVTNDDALAEKMRLLKGQGMDPKRRYWFPIVGYNYRMTNIQAAIGLAQLENIEVHLGKRRELAAQYLQGLAGLGDFLDFQHEQPWAKHTYWMFSILLKKRVALTRDEFMQKLAEAGVETRPLFYPMHVMPPYLEPSEKYPVATDLAARGINLPTHGSLSREDVDYVVENIIRLVRGSAQ
jgi:perosamine synthetase